MKKGIALLLALLMIMSSLFVVSSAEDGAAEPTEANGEIINEIITLPGEADPEEVSGDIGGEEAEAGAEAGEPERG